MASNDRGRLIKQPDGHGLEWEVETDLLQRMHVCEWRALTSEPFVLSGPSHGSDAELKMELVAYVKKSDNDDDDLTFGVKLPATVGAVRFLITAHEGLLDQKRPEVRRRDRKVGVLVLQEGHHHPKKEAQLLRPFGAERKRTSGQLISWSECALRETLVSLPSLWFLPF